MHSIAGYTFPKMRPASWRALRTCLRMQLKIRTSRCILTPLKVHCAKLLRSFFQFAGQVAWQPTQITKVSRSCDASWRYIVQLQRIPGAGDNREVRPALPALCGPAPGCSALEIGTEQRRLAWPLRKDDTMNLLGFACCRPCAELVLAPLDNALP